MTMFVSVVDFDQKPLMPTTPSRARRLIKSGEATYFWKKGVFCIRLNREPSNRYKQKITVGVDPGSKKEGFTVKSRAHTFLNIQADAVTNVKKAVETRSVMRKARRLRNTPCRQNKQNKACRTKSRLPPSTKARWQFKLNICKWLCKIFPISSFIVEDIQARSKENQRKWNQSFSPLEVGKNWFYGELKKLGEVTTKYGWETKKLRDKYGLKKSKDKLAETFSAHCVDSWVLANSQVDGHKEPDNTRLLFITPIRLHRRWLHDLQPRKNDIRSKYGGTRSLGFKRGSLVRHLKYGLCYIGGTSKDRISLHDYKNKKRLSKIIKPSDCEFLTYLSWINPNALSGA